MRLLLLLPALLLSLLLFGCASKEEEPKPKPIEKSYFYFTGYVDDLKISIDDGIRFDFVSSKKNIYSIDEGEHVIDIYRRDRIILRYELNLIEGKVKEIVID